MSLISKVVASGLAVALIFGLAGLLLPLLLPFLVMPGVVPAIAIAALSNTHLEAWASANGVEGPILFAAVAGISSILIWWMLCVVVWVCIERIRTRRRSLGE